MDLIQGFESVVRENEPLAPYTRLRIGGVAEFFAEPTSLEQLAGLIVRFREADLPVRLLGGGSNLLVRDEGTAGLVISLSAPVFCRLETNGDSVVVGGGTRVAHLVSVGAEHGFSGIENLVGIPGTVGGALHGNAGNQHAAIGNWTSRATVVTRRGQIVTRESHEINFAYRQSSLTELVIVDATLQFELEDPGKLTRRMQKLWIVKRANQPGPDEFAAYVFRDEGGEPAGRLIEQAGLRGTRIGGVEISSRDANFFVASPGAASDDVLRLIELVQTRVSDRMGVTLRQSLVVW
jgi:UDP-N-acetylmuramate dehydrogenase